MPLTYGHGSGRPGSVQFIRTERMGSRRGGILAETVTFEPGKSYFIASFSFYKVLIIGFLRGPPAEFGFGPQVVQIIRNGRIPGRGTCHFPGQVIRGGIVDQTVRRVDVFLVRIAEQVAVDLVPVSSSVKFQKVLAAENAVCRSVKRFLHAVAV